MKPALRVVGGLHGPPTPRHLRLLQRWHAKTRADLRELGADYTALCQLDELADRLRPLLWRGVSSG